MILSDFQISTEDLWYLSLFQEISHAAALIEHLLHSLPLHGHPDTTSPNSGLNSNKSLHAP
jgi:hypothetical protein